MKTAKQFIPYKIILLVLFYTNVIKGESNPLPSGLEEPPALNIDLYMIPMIIIGIIFGFFFIKKNTQVK